MPLQNRVTPDNTIIAEPWRGDFMGNKGGRIHDPETRCLLKRRWASRRWIICVTEFKDRQRNVMGDGYTELFFLDEVSALAAGHRPCFECRRGAAKDFADIWEKTHGDIKGSKADCIDLHLHNERTGKSPLLNQAQLVSLPDGAMVKSGPSCFAKFDGKFRLWSGDGYSSSETQLQEAVLLTPPSTVSVLENGYQPIWHASTG